MKQNKFYLPHSMRTGPLLDRFTAFVIDLMVLMMLGGVLAPFAGKAILFLISWAYFTLCHGFWGYTIGKKAVGLRVISANERSVTWPRWLLRDTVGRPLCGAFFCAGYLRAVFAADRRGWHDMIAGTLVVTEKKYAGSFVRSAGISLSLLFTFVGSILFLALKTSMIGGMLVSRLEKTGDVVRGLRGNPIDGWSLEYWQHDSPQGSYTLRGIQLDFSLKSLFTEGLLHVKKLQVTQADIIDKGVFDSLKKPKAKEEPQDEVADAVKARQPRRKSESAALIDGLWIEKINIGQVNVTHPSGMNLNISQFYLSQLRVKNKVASLVQLHLSAEQGEFDLWDSKWHLEQNHFILNAKVAARPSLHKMIRSPFSATMQYQGTLDAPELINILGFDNRINLRYSPGVLNLHVKGFSPGQYFHAPGYPISRVTMAGDNALCKKLSCVFDVNARGSFYLRNKKFRFENFRASVEDSETTEKLKLQPMGLILSIFLPMPVFNIATDREVEEYLAELYFGSRGQEAALTTHRRTLAADAKLFNKYANRPEGATSDEFVLDPALMKPGRRPTAVPKTETPQTENK